MGLRVTVLPPPKGIGGILMAVMGSEPSGVPSPDSYLSPEIFMINQNSLLVKVGT